jgi:WD40 repeat protein
LLLHLSDKKTLMKKAIFLFLLFPILINAQQSKLLEPGIISNDGVFGFTLSPDGNRALWVDSNGGRDTLIIKESVKRNGKWQKPVPASFSNRIPHKDIDPVFSPDGKTVFLQSNRPVPNHPNRKGFDIYSVTKTENGWSEPKHLGDVVNTDASESFASITKKGNLYFMKDNENGTGKSDIYVAEFKNGMYIGLKNIGAPINTNERESNPYISPNEDYIIYFSTDPKGFGDVDLYISFRIKNQWTIPQNLGNEINSEAAEFCPFVHQKENRFYFARQKKRGEKRFIENIYYYDNFNTLLKKLKKSAVLQKT